MKDKELLTRALVRSETTKNYWRDKASESGDYWDVYHYLEARENLKQLKTMEEQTCSKEENN